MRNSSFCVSFPNRTPDFYFHKKRCRLKRHLSLSINPGVDKGPQPLMFNPALTTCASERMKTKRFSYFAGFAARERMREAKPVKTRKSGARPLFRHSEMSPEATSRLWITEFPTCLVLVFSIPCKPYKANIPIFIAAGKQRGIYIHFVR